MMIHEQSFSVNMFRLLSLIPKADQSWITVGPTGSGKTTLNEVLVKQIHPLSRIITIENPSEMRLHRREGENLAPSSMMCCSTNPCLKRMMPVRLRWRTC